jgi:hypothetical protein
MLINSIRQDFGRNFIRNVRGIDWALRPAEPMTHHAPSETRAAVTH